MKHLIWIAALLLALSACSKEEQPESVADEAAAIEAPAPDATAQEAVEAAEEAAPETLEVVEESASEEEPKDEPILLAMADSEDAPVREWKYKEGQHYDRIVPTQQTVGSPDKVEVAEIFEYSCPHCFDMDPHISRWTETMDPGVRFVRIPAIFNNLDAIHAQAFYTGEVLARNGVLADLDALHVAIFTEFHNRRNRLTSESAIQKLFQRFGVSQADFDKTWKSFEVNQKMRIAQDLVRRYGISKVPTVVVNGKYRTSASQTGSYEGLFEAIDELTAREGIR